MIYFLVNNNYHYFDFCAHADDLCQDLALIEVPHTLDVHQNVHVKVRYRYEISRSASLIKQIFDFVLQAKRIKKEMAPKDTDILFFYTEYEILNQYVVNLFKSAGATVYLIEDGGLGTYIPFRCLVSESLSVKEYLKRALYRLFPGLSNLRFHKLNGLIFPWLPDSQIDAVCIYKRVRLHRSIPVFVIQRPPQVQLSLVEGRVIFLNEPLYQIYQSSEDYLDGLYNIIEGLCRIYQEVYFKFHPRETEEWRRRICEGVIGRFAKINVIEDDVIIEMLVEKYAPSVMASYFCSALLSVCDRGIHPLYLYHLVPDLNSQPVFVETTAVLNELGYNFVSSLIDLGPAYTSGMLKENYKDAIALNSLPKI